jgi:transcriptional regulator with XRE-family HTH domain
MELNSTRQEAFSVPLPPIVAHLAAMDPWHHRLLKALGRKGWSQTELARRADVPEQRVFKYIQGKVDQPRGDIIPRLARTLGVHSAWLRDGIGPELSAVPVVGYVGAGETFIPAADTQLGELALDMQADDPIAVIVRGTSMAPVYRPGDHLLCSRVSAAEVAQFIGRDCVVLTTEGLGYVKKVVKGSEPERFTLLSYNADPIENAQLSWAAPVLWVKRA